MTKIRSTKNALISAILVLCMAFTGLVGTTFAWFTDSVTSSGNKIQAGTLKIDLELLDEKSNTWKSLKNESDPIFDYAKWEPGYTDVKLLKVENFGTLALTWKTVLTKHGEISALADVIDVYVRDYGVLTDEQAAALTYPADRSLAGYTRVGTAAEFLSAMEETTKGALEAGQSAYLGLALKMRTDAGNEYQGMTLGGTFDITVYATQTVGEEDSFGSDYDDGATFPLAPGEISKVGASVTADANNQVSAPVEYNNDFVKTEIPTGALLEDGATTVETVVSYTERTADVQMQSGQVSRTLDLHVNGLSENNTVPVKHTLSEFFPKNYSRSNVSIYHVDNGVTVLMTHVDNLADLDAHNEMYYDPATGDVVVSMATHSEIVAVTNVGNPWDGETVTYEWYNNPVNGVYTLTSVSDFVGFARIVGGMDGKTADTFKGKTVKLTADINLGSKTFYPVGYYNSTGKFDKESGGNVTSDFNPFSGTFDGQGHTMANIYQNTWDMFGDYNSGYSGTPNHYKDGMGIFGWVHGGTVKNLAVHNFSSDGEFTTTGCVAAYSSGTSTFENIRVSNSNPRAYNVPNGGVVGYAYSGNDPESPDHITFTNVTVDTTTKITALWGSWDVGCGGILGRVSDASKVTMRDCTVGAVIDVYSDVCGNYQYYQFRYAGMLIGTVGSDEDTTDQKPNLTFTNITVYYGDWANDLHYYCELVENSLASYTHDYQMSRLTKINSVGEIQDANGKWNKTGDYVVVAADGTAKCYHIRQDANGFYERTHDEKGTQNVDGKEVLVEDKQCVHIPFNQLYSGYGWGAQHVSDGVDAKEVKYTITYINDGEVLNVVYVSEEEAAAVVSTDNEAAKDLVLKWAEQNIQGGTIAFGGWMNAASIKLASIDAGNTKDVVLYPFFNSPYTATFVDQDANILAWCLFNDSDVSRLSGAFEQATANLPKLDGDYELINWKVKGTDKKDKEVNATLPLTPSKNDLNAFTGYKDVTITPHYRYKGADLIEVIDELTGETISYQVGGYTDGVGSTIVEIPAYVNGKPVTTVNEDAFSSYDDLHSVRIPSTITRVNFQSFTADTPDTWNPSTWGDQRDTITIYYEFDPANPNKWNDAMTAYNNRGNNYDADEKAMLASGWDNMMGEGSCVFFLDANGKVDLSKGYWELAKVSSKFIWQYHNYNNHPYGSNSNCGNEHNNKTDYTANCKCDLGTHERPDKEYWTPATTTEE